MKTANLLLALAGAPGLLSPLSDPQQQSQAAQAKAFDASYAKAAARPAVDAQVRKTFKVYSFEIQGRRYVALGFPPTVKNLEITIRSGFVKSKDIVAYITAPPSATSLPPEAAKESGFLPLPVDYDPLGKIDVRAIMLGSKSLRTTKPLTFPMKDATEAKVELNQGTGELGRVG